MCLLVFVFLSLSILVFPIWCLLYRISQSLNGKWVLRTESIRFVCLHEVKQNQYITFSIPSVHYKWISIKYEARAITIYATHRGDDLVCACMQYHNIELPPISHVTQNNNNHKLENKFREYFFSSLFFSFRFRRKEPSSMSICWYLILHRDHLTYIFSRVFKKIRWCQDNTKIRCENFFFHEPKNSWFRNSDTVGYHSKGTK